MHEPEAEVIRSIFDSYVNERRPLLSIARSLEARKVPTRQGSFLWPTTAVRNILKNETYAGVRYCNRYKTGQETTPEGRKLPRKQSERDRSEWIAISVPAIVSREVSEMAQARLRERATGHRLPRLTFLLTGLLYCSHCGHTYFGYHRPFKVATVTRGQVVHHKAAYICGQKKRAYGHVKGLVRSCHNSEVATHIVEHKVFDMIRETLLDPEKLRACTHLSTIDEAERSVIAAQLARLESRMGHIHAERKELVDLFASGVLSEDAYARQNAALDCELDLLSGKIGELKPFLNNHLAAETSLRIFSATAKARFEACSDFEACRQFLLDHFEKVIFDRGKVSVVGSIPIIDPMQTGEAARITFRIEGEIDSSRRSPKAWYPPFLRAKAVGPANTEARQRGRQERTTKREEKLHSRGAPAAVLVQPSPCYDA